MNIRDCQRILQVPASAGLDEVKAAFRKLAFTLHPDLNPAPDAADKFRELNEAYILLTRTLSDDPAERMARARREREGRDKAEGPPDAKARKAQAGRAYAKNATQQPGASTAAGAGQKTGPKTGQTPGQAAGSKTQGASSSSGSTGASNSGFHIREEEVLRDLLSDPFARQVFEDIYSQLKHGAPGSGQQTRATQPQGQRRQQARPTAPKRRRLELAWGDKTMQLDA